MPTGSTLPVRLCLRSLTNVSVIARHFGDRPVQPQRRVDVVREQIAGDAAAGDGDVEPPQPFAALRQVLRDRPVLQELRAVVEDAPELALVDELLDHRDGRHAAVVVPDRVRHARRLDRGDHRSAASAALRPSGFSHITILPAFAAAIAIVVVRVVGAGDVDEVDVLAVDQLAPVGRVRTRSPSSRRTSSRAPRCARRPPSAPASGRSKKRGACGTHSSASVP